MKVAKIHLGDGSPVIYQDVKEVNEKQNGIEIVQFRKDRNGKVCSLLSMSHVFMYSAIKSYHVGHDGDIL